MVKYIDAEKIRSEVERIKETGCESPISVCNDILSFIDSLQQEQPEMDLEKEVDKFLNETGAPYVWCDDDEQKEWCNIIARHFYNLGINAGKVW